MTRPTSSSQRFLLGGVLGALLAVLLLELLRPLNGNPVGVMAWAGVIVLVAVLTGAAVVSAADQLKRQARRSHAIAIAAQRVGLAIDVNEVAGAVLLAAREVFAEADFGGVLVYDPETRLLVPLPISMQGGEVGIHEQTRRFDISPGEGVAGKVFVAAAARCWRNSLEVMREHGDMKNITRDRILALTGGMRSVAAAPLQLQEQGVFGVLTLGSSKRDNVWGSEDMVVLQGLADQAALGVERARMYQEQRAEAMTDPLTGLANYRQLKAVVGVEVARARRGATRLAVLFFDLDGFKAVNDQHGHGAGDGVLRLLARSMHEVLRTEDLAARYGGDEFVCVLPGADAAQAEVVVQRIRGRFLELLQLDDELRTVRTYPSSGCAVYPEQGTAAEELLVAADAALLRAKQAVGHHPPPAPG